MDSANQANGPSETIGSIISKVDDVLKNERPDAVLVLGDTNSCLSEVIPAKEGKYQFSTWKLGIGVRFRVRRNQ